MAMTLIPPSCTHQRARTTRRASVHLPALPPLSPDNPTSSFQSYGHSFPSRDLLTSSFQSYSSPVMSCSSHPSSTAVASCSLPTTSPVFTSSAQLDLAKASLVAGSSTPHHIPTSPTQNSPPPLPPPVLNFGNATGTQEPETSSAGATPLSCRPSATPTSSTSAHAGTILHSSMNYSTF